MQWLHNRLLPSSAERYPGQRMVLVMDNAAYHHHWGSDWINPHRLKKAPMAAKLIELGVSSVSVQRQKKGTLRNNTCSTQRRSLDTAVDTHPRWPELKAELMVYLAAHPGMNRTECQNRTLYHPWEAPTQHAWIVTLHRYRTQ